MTPTINLSANIENGFAAGTQYIVTPNAQQSIATIVNDYQTGIHSFTIMGLTAQESQVSCLLWNPI